MPRHHVHPLHRLPAAAGTASLGAAAVAFLLLCVFALAACASHSSRWFFRRRRHSEPVISNHQVQPGAAECVWQKSILMGGKCELPDFSGVVSYDSAGNLVVAGRTQPTMSLK
ncbi:uncharacterized protein LOC121995759 [Zingiber officinale]|uniref:uncharacterized protein LOC121995759 n=1 Tax=Zingiber officinale TaxID=94328 RepID=UPI001C4C06EC|nr:uncharacterized protein LOC121995759 [Zingiber officinale]